MHEISKFIFHNVTNRQSSEKHSWDYCIRILGQQMCDVDALIEFTMNSDQF